MKNLLYIPNAILTVDKEHIEEEKADQSRMGAQTMAEVSHLRIQSFHINNRKPRI